MPHAHVLIVLEDSSKIDTIRKVENIVWVSRLSPMK